MIASIVDLGARRRRGALAETLVAAAPVRHVPLAFLLAMKCVDVDELAAWTRPSPPARLRPVAG